MLTAAILTAIIYAFRRAVEPTTNPTSSVASSKAAGLVGAGAPPSLGRWATSYAAAFLMLSILALGAPELAASLAMMAVVGNLLTNGITIATDLTRLEGADSQANRTGSTGTTLKSPPSASSHAGG